MSKRHPKKKNRPPKSPKAPSTVAAQEESVAASEPDREEGPALDAEGGDVPTPENLEAAPADSGDSVMPEAADVAASNEDVPAETVQEASGEESPIENVSVEEAPVEGASVEAPTSDEEATAPVEETSPPPGSDSPATSTVPVEDGGEQIVVAADGAEATEDAVEASAPVEPATAGEPVVDEWGAAPEGPLSEVSNEEFASAWADATAASGEGAGEVDPSAEAPVGESGGTLPDGEEAPLVGDRLESVIESMLFASDKALGVADLKKLLGEREGKKITEALESLTERRKGSGIEVVRLSSGWHLRTNAENAPWVSKILSGKPMRLSRAMMETLAIVAYRQPVTRPEIDDIRGVDCGPVLKTLLERNLIRVIGKKEEVGRPMLYGTTPEFLRVFNLRDLTEMPTLREFYDLSTENQAKVESEHGPTPPSATSPKPEVAMGFVARGELPPELEEDDPLLDEIDRATALAKKALGDAQGPGPDEEPKPEDDAQAAPPPAES